MKLSRTLAIIAVLLLTIGCKKKRHIRELTIQELEKIGSFKRDTIFVDSLGVKWDVSVGYSTVFKKSKRDTSR